MIFLNVFFIMIVIGLVFFFGVGCDFIIGLMLFVIRNEKYF